MDLSRANLLDNPDLAGHKDSVSLDNQPSFAILKVLFFPQPLTSTQEVPYGETPQNGQAYILAGGFILLGQLVVSTFLLGRKRCGRALASRNNGGIS